MAKEHTGLPQYATVAASSCMSFTGELLVDMTLVHVDRVCLETLKIGCPSITLRDSC